MATFFVDTNFFLQVKAPESLPWRELTNDAEVLLLVPRAVQTELDRLKQDGNARRSKRARTAASLLRRAVQAPNTTMVIKDAAPCVSISFPPINNAPPPRPATLDVSRNDDQIVAELLEYRAANPCANALLLTADSGPMLTARHHSVPFVAVPENWFLAPETDDRDKTIQALSRELDTLKRNHPAIEIRAWTENATIDRIDERVQCFAPLAEQTINELLATIQRRCPPAEEFALSASELRLRRAAGIALGETVGYTKPTDEEITAYQKEAYPEWVATMRSVLEDINSRLNQQPQCVALTVHVANTGTVPASGVILEFSAHGEISMQEPREDGGWDSEIITLPSPPDPPRGRLKEHRSSSMLDPRSMRSLDLLRTPPVRDRYAFYGPSQRTASKLLRYTCDEFRHQEKARVFEFFVIVPQGRPVASIVTCRLSAANLPAPAEVRIPILTSIITADTEKYVRELIGRLPRTVRSIAPL